MLPHRATAPTTAATAMLAAALAAVVAAPFAPATAQAPAAGQRAETVSTSTDPTGDVRFDRDERGLSYRDRRSIDLDRLVVRRLGGGGLSLVVDLARLAPRDARWDQLVTVRLVVPGTGEPGDPENPDDPGTPDDTYGVFVTSDPGQDPQVATRVAGEDRQQCDARVDRVPAAGRLRVKVPAACAAPRGARGSLQATTRDLDDRDRPAWSGDRMRVRPLRG